MLKAFARDVAGLVAAVLVVGATLASLAFTLVLWRVPPAEEVRFWLAVPFLGLVAVSMVSASVLLYVPLRGRARLGRPLEPRRWRETLAIPVLLGLLAGVAALLISFAADHRWDAAPAVLAGSLEIVFLVLAVRLVILVQRLATRPTRTLLLIAGALVVVWLGGRLALDVWGNRLFAHHAAGLRTEIAAERARIAADRRPVLFGTPLDDNAAARYRSLDKKTREKLNDRPAAPLLAAGVKEQPGRPVSAEATALIERCDPELRALQEAVRCTRCDWQVQWERGPAAPIPSLAGGRGVAQLLVIEGLRQAAAGDVDGALQRDLEVIRLGSDHEGAGGLIGPLIGIAIESIGIEALLQLVAADDLRVRLAWETLQAKLDVLEPRLASASVGYRSERLLAVGWPPFAGEGETPLAPARLQPLFELLVPSRLILASGIRQIDEALRAIESANALPDSREARRRGQAAVEHALASRNLVVHLALPSGERARIAQDRLAARFRLLRAVAQLEQAREREGRYPAAGASLVLPVDPFAYPAQIHYACLAEGRGYKLWSVGENGRDDGGLAQDRADEVVERRPR